MFKTILKIILVGLGALLIIIAGIVGTAMVYERNAEPVFVNQATEFKNELKIPPLLEPVEQDGKKVFNLTLQQGETEFFEGIKTRWATRGFPRPACTSR